MPTLPTICLRGYRNYATVTYCKTQAYKEKGGQGGQVGIGCGFAIHYREDRMTATSDLGPAWRHTARGPVPAWHGATADLHIAEIADLDTPHLHRTVRLARRADPIDRLALPADVLAATYRWRGAG
jgi:hypothetical protein